MKIICLVLALLLSGCSRGVVKVWVYDDVHQDVLDRNREAGCVATGRKRFANPIYVAPIKSDHYGYSSYGSSAQSEYACPSDNIDHVGHFGFSRPDDEIRSWFIGCEGENPVMAYDGEEAGMGKWVQLAPSDHWTRKMGLCKKGG